MDIKADSYLVHQRKSKDASNKLLNVKNKYLNFCGWVITLGGLVFGIDTGATNGSLSFMARSDQLNLNASQEGLVTSGITLGAAFGAVSGGKLSDHFGRKKVLSFAAWIFILGTLGCVFAPNAAVLIACRFLLGLAVGAESAISPVFLSELATTDDRGKLVNRHELMITSGQLLSYVVNAIFGVTLSHFHAVWRLMLGFGLIPEVLLLIGIHSIPESPRWLVAKSHIDEASSVLKKVRDPEDDTGKEISEINNSLALKGHQKTATIKDLNIPWVRRLVLIGIGLGIMQQIVGVNIMMFYGTTVLTQSGFNHSAALIANIANGIISVLATILSIKLINKIDRKKMICTAVTGTTITMFLITVLSKRLSGSAAFPFVMIALMVIFLFFVQSGISPVTWVLLSEIFPQSIRGMAMGIATFFLWFANFLVGDLFPILLSAIRLSHTFLVFTGTNLLALIFAVKFVPETRGKSLEELQAEFKNQD